MERDEFEVWAENAAAERDATIKELNIMADAVLRTWLVEQLQKS